MKTFIEETWGDERNEDVDPYTGETDEERAEYNYSDRDWMRWSRAKWEVAKDTLPIDDGGFRVGALFSETDIIEMRKDPEVLRDGMILHDRLHGEYFTVRHYDSGNNRWGWRASLVETTPHELAELGIL